jgi:hypothetical protein
MEESRCDECTCSKCYINDICRCAGCEQDVPLSDCTEEVELV